MFAALDPAEEAGLEDSSVSMAVDWLPLDSVFAFLAALSFFFLAFDFSLLPFTFFSSFSSSLLSLAFRSFLFFLLLLLQLPFLMVLVSRLDVVLECALFALVALPKVEVLALATILLLLGVAVPALLLSGAVGVSAEDLPLQPDNCGFVVRLSDQETVH